MLVLKKKRGGKSKKNKKIKINLVFKRMKLKEMGGKSKRD